MHQEGTGGARLVDIQLQDVEGDFDIDVDLTTKKRCRKLLEVEIFLPTLSSS